MTQDIQIILINAVLFGGGFLVKDWLDRQREKRNKLETAARSEIELQRVKAETQNLVTNQYSELIQNLRTERTEDRQMIADNRAEIKQQAADNAECEYKHDVVELELQHLKKQIEYQDYQKETVFVIDDNATTGEIFRRLLSRISVINCKVFLDHRIFLTDVQKEKPGIVILDHYLDKDLTAADIIKLIGYTPEVFIMSSTKEVHLIYADMGYKFFYKGENYVQKISKAILEHLKSKAI